MGNVAQTGVVLHAEVPSVSEPQKLCIQSEPLIKIDPPILKEELFDEIEIVFRTSRTLIKKHGHTLKRLELQEHSPHSFTVKLVLDGKLLDAEGKGRGRGDGQDKILRHCRCSFDREEWIITIEHFVHPHVSGHWEDEVPESEGAGVPVMTMMIYHLESTCLEYIVEVDGKPRADKEMTAEIQKRITEIGKLCQLASLSPVLVRHDAPSIKEPGSLSNCSYPIAEDVTYEELFTCMVALIRSSAGDTKNHALVDVEGEDDVEGGDFVDQRETMAMAPAAGADRAILKATSKPFLCTTEKRKINRNVQSCPETGEITLSQIAVTDEGDIAWPAWSRVSHYFIHRDPLVAESWFSYGALEHGTNAVHARQLQDFLNQALDLVKTMREQVSKGEEVNLIDKLG